MNSVVKMNCGGRNQRVGKFLVNRLLPDQQVRKIGPFVFFDHVYPVALQGDRSGHSLGKDAHPHRGIVTLTYLLSGSLQYCDSRDHQGAIATGGALWLKAGNGIVHDEQPGPDRQGGVFHDREGSVFHALYFWINLPGVNKLEAPEYKAVAAADIPELELPENAGLLRLVLGTCGALRSPVSTFLNEFIYHIRLNPKSEFSYPTRKDTEYAVFVPSDEIRVNDQLTGRSHLVVYSRADAVIRLRNPGIAVADAFIFGGSEYAEPIFAAGPFVMNTRDEIARAYDDFFAGAYGKLT